ncbi:MAG: hypothetical protein IJU76_15870 [Desulfovibrionaceae bacterium]|nr:hypothetical protein [Desulfovibrionaceae bacterium]
MRDGHISVAVCVHLYYVEMFREISAYLDNFKEIRYDLFITMPRENKAYLPVIRKKYPNAKAIICENVGFDIYPYLRFLKEIDLLSYDVIFKLHSKKDIPIDFSRNGVDLSGTKWRDYMFQALLGSPERIQCILRIVERHPHVGMVCAQEVLLCGADQIAQDISLERVEAVMLECGMRIRTWEFVAGSIFAVRPKLLVPLKRRNFQASEFPPYYPRDWNSLPYCLERVFGCMVSAQGLTICGLPPCL